MKKGGILVIIMLILVLISISAATFAFYPTADTRFDIYIEGVTGSALYFSVDTSQKIIQPKKTTSQIDKYTAVAGDQGKYAVYVLKYVQSNTDPISVNLKLDEIKYYINSTLAQNAYTDYISKYLSYTFLIKDSTYIYSQETDALPTESEATWINFNTNASVIEMSNIAYGEGYFLLYIKLDDTLTDELLPPELNLLLMEFSINTAIIENPQQVLNNT